MNIDQKLSKQLSGSLSKTLYRCGKREPVITEMIVELVLVLRHLISKYYWNQYHIAVTECIDWNGMIVLKELICTMAQMAHFSFPYYLTIPNSEFRNLHYMYEFRNSEL